MIARTVGRVQAEVRGSRGFRAVVGVPDGGDASVAAAREPWDWSGAHSPMTDQRNPIMMKKPTNSEISAKPP